MKIGLINTLYHPYQVGGAERSVRLLAEAMVAAGHDVFVITCGEQRGVDRLNGVRIYREPLANVYWPFAPDSRTQVLKPLWHLIDTLNPLMAARVKRILRSERPDVVNTNNVGGFSVAVWPVIKALGIPVVHTLRDYYLLCIRSTLYRQTENSNCDNLCGVCRTLSAPRRQRSAQVDRVIGISAAVLREHTARGLFAGLPTAVIPNIAGLETQKPVHKPAPFVRFGYLGRLEPSKGVAEMLKAFSLALGVREDLRLIVGGDGESAYVNPLHSEFTDPAIEFRGRMDPAALFGEIDFLIVPSRWKEPLGRVVLEAYHFGVPVLGARRGGIAENIVNGGTGFSFDIATPEALTDLILHCASMGEVRYRQLTAALPAQTERYSAAAIARAYCAELAAAAEGEQCRA